jgi:hypothetical protein
MKLAPLAINVFVGFLISLTPSLVNAELLFKDGFESGNIDNWECSGNCATVTTSQPRAGTYAGQFTLTPKDPVSFRTELVPPESTYFDQGKEYWIGFSNKLVDWQRDNSEELVLQTHTNYYNWDCAFKTGGDVGRQPISILTGSGNWHVVTGSGGEWSAPYTTGVWNNWVIHLKVSTGSDGFVEVWKDGVKVISDTGPNYPAKDQCGNSMAPPYLKFGIYKWDWDKSGDRSQPSQSTRREIHFDQVRIGHAAAGYAGVAP